MVSALFSLAFLSKAKSARSFHRTVHRKNRFRFGECEHGKLSLAKRRMEILKLRKLFNDCDCAAHGHCPLDPAPLVFRWAVNSLL